ncbi:hypothetical protein [Streptomyces sp. NPDC058989]|uniref:hypothetical protein n=1 Tax=Streptomyces sp. NPDC058989 TaxID=3346686 RepID=UPI0036922662
MIRAALSLLLRPLHKRLKPVLAAVGRWFGLLFVIFLSMATGAVIALAIIGNTP